MRKIIATIIISAKGQTNGGIFYLFPNIIVNIIYLLPLMFLWRIIASNNIDAGMTLEQLLTYTYMNTILAQMLVVRTFASSWIYDGQLMRLFTRPAFVFSQIIAQTIGEWIPMLVIFSLPMFLIAPLFQINTTPYTLWFFLSLILCISLGFAIDFIFSCLTIYLKGMSWLVYSIRMAIISLFSGAVIPFRILPFNLNIFFELQPFGSLGGAPLSLFVGTSEPFRILLIQIIWNMILWPAAILWFKKSKERQVSYGG